MNAKDKIMKVAVKSRICDIVNGKYNSSGDNVGFNYLESAVGIKMNKARILGTVVQKFISDNSDKPFAIITIDDSTETISCRLWNNLDLIQDIEVGDIVDLIGLLREYNNEIYIVPDLIKKIDDFNYETLRRLEIAESLEKLGIKKEAKEDKQVQKQETTATNETDDTVVSTDNQSTTDKSSSVPRVREILMQKINELDNGDGADIEEVITVDNSAEDILKELLNEGTCYEPRMGRVKLL